MLNEPDDGSTSLPQADRLGPTRTMSPGPSEVGYLRAKAATACYTSAKGDHGLGISDHVETDCCSLGANASRFDRSLGAKVAPEP
jgi:hypothetical protein